MSCSCNLPRSLTADQFFSNRLEIHRQNRKSISNMVNPSKFLIVPEDIRTLIYHILFTGGVTRGPASKSNVLRNPLFLARYCGVHKKGLEYNLLKHDVRLFGRSKSISSILRTCKQVFAEATPIFWQHVKLILDCVESSGSIFGLHNYLCDTMLPFMSETPIRHLQLNMAFLLSTPQNIPRFIARKLPQLKTLEVTNFNLRHNQRHRVPDHDFDPKQQECLALNLTLEQFQDRSILGGARNCIEEFGLKGKHGRGYELVLHVTVSSRVVFPNQNTGVEYWVSSYVSTYA